MNSQLFRTIGWNVIQLRQGKGLRQEDLADSAEVSRQQIGRIERGLGEISFDSLIKVADFFEVSVSTLCEEPVKKQDLAIALRRSLKEKTDVKFSKVFSEAPKMRVIELGARGVRRLQIQSDQVYDLLVLNGELLLTSENYSNQISENQSVSIKGCGTVRMRSYFAAKKCEILLVQSSAK